MKLFINADKWYSVIYWSNRIKLPSLSYMVCLFHLNCFLKLAACGSWNFTFDKTPCGKLFCSAWCKIWVFLLFDSKFVTSEWLLYDNRSHIVNFKHLVWIWNSFSLVGFHNQLALNLVKPRHIYFKKYQSFRWA